jgi:hypothetical protein
MSTPGPFERLLMNSITTVDDGIVLHTEVSLILDPDEEVTQRRMDTVVQNAMVHGWRSASDEVTVMAFVLLGAQPVADPSSGDEVERSVL